MVDAAAGRDRGLLQVPQPRRRLAGVKDRRAGTDDRLGVAGGQGGDAGEVAEEVDRGPLGREQGAGAAAGDQHLGRHVLAPLALDDEVVDVLDPALAHRLGNDRKAEDDARLFLHDSRPAAGALGHRRLGGDVPLAEVLGEGTADQLLDFLRQLDHHATLAIRLFPIRVRHG